MTSEVKERIQWVQEAIADTAQHDLAVHSQPGSEVFLKDYNWGPVPFRSYELAGYRWRHMIKPSVNETGLYPLGHAVLIAPEASEYETIIALPEGERDKALMNSIIGKIVEIGPSAWMDEPTPRAFPGEMVCISKFAGAIVVGKDGKPYRMVNADDVYCRRDSDWPKRQVLEAPRVERRGKKESYDE
jgi:co-chaperonin GroES (HSP10)